MKINVKLLEKLENHKDFIDEYEKLCKKYGHYIVFDYIHEEFSASEYGDEKELDEHIKQLRDDFDREKQG